MGRAEINVGALQFTKCCVMSENYSFSLLTGLYIESRFIFQNFNVPSLRHIQNVTIVLIEDKRIFGLRPNFVITMAGVWRRFLRILKAIFMEHLADFTLFCDLYSLRLSAHIAVAKRLDRIP